MSRNMVQITPHPASPIDVTTLRIRVEITDVDRHQTASFVTTAAGNTIPIPTLSPVPNQVPAVHTIVTKGDPVSFTTSPTGVKLDDFVGRVEITQSPGVGAGQFSKGGNFNFTFEPLEDRSIVTNKNPVSVSAGQGPGTMPAINFGAIFHGTLQMDGAPVSAP